MFNGSTSTKHPLNLKRISYSVSLHKEKDFLGYEILLLLQYYYYQQYY